MGFREWFDLPLVRRTKENVDGYRNLEQACR
jgi:hypothetical protein